MHNIREHLHIDASMLTLEEIATKYQSEVSTSGTGKDFLTGNNTINDIIKYQEDHKKMINRITKE